MQASDLDTTPLPLRVFSEHKPLPLSKRWGVFRARVAMWWDRRIRRRRLGGAVDQLRQEFEQHGCPVGALGDLYLVEEVAGALAMMWPEIYLSMYFWNHQDRDQVAVNIRTFAMFAETDLRTFIQQVYHVMGYRNHLLRQYAWRQGVERKWEDLASNRRPSLAEVIQRQMLRSAAGGRVDWRATTSRLDLAQGVCTTPLYTRGNTDVLTNKLVEGDY